MRVTLQDGALMPEGGSGASQRSGRGAYLCRDATCVARAVARDALLLRRALRIRGDVRVPEELERVGSPAS